MSRLWSNPWVDPAIEHDQYMTDLLLEEAAIEDQLASVRALIATAEQWQPEPSPGIDARVFPSAGTDEREMWR